MSSSDETPRAPGDMDALAADGAKAFDVMAKAYVQALNQAAAMWTHGAKTLAAGDTSAADPDPMHIAKDAAEVWTKLAANPAAIAEAQMKLWTGTMEIWSSAAQRIAEDGQAKSVADPAPGDRRWRDADWREHPMFDVIKQSYLLTANWLTDLVDSAEGVDPAAKRKVAFFTKQLADAFSPTNFPFTNPEVLRTALEERGENFVRGMQRFAADFERGGGRIAIQQTVSEAFTVGENVANAPGDVVFECPLFQLIQYKPTTDKVYETPLLIFPPWINKFYILDLREQNSMVRWLTDQGHQVFLVSWVNPTPELASKTFDDYMTEGIFTAVDQACKQAGVTAVNTVGYCIGGTLLASTLAYMGRTGDDRIQSATFFAAQTDFSEAGELLMFVDDEWMGEIERRMDANDGVLDGQTMADTFNMLRANDLVWSFFVNNYLLGKTPRAFDLLYWNSDQTRLSKTLHLYYLDQFYRKNALTSGNLRMAGRPVSLSDVTIPIYMQASKEDHIAPFGSVYRGAKAFGGPVRFILAGSGHIAGVINHPDANKYQHWLPADDALPETAEDWFAGASEHPGSWWLDWNSWLSARSGKKIAPTPADKRPLQPIEPAPGRYVVAP